jgi:hypothetical protein
MISSELIPSVASDQCTAAVLNEIGINQATGPVGYMVFRTVCGDKEFLCAWAGGSVGDDGNLSLTAIGIGALEALSRLEADSREGIEVFTIDADSLEQLQLRVVSALSSLPNRSRVVFVGDVAGKLREWLPQAFNVVNWQTLVNS